MTATTINQTLGKCGGFNKYGQPCGRSVKSGSFCLYHSTEIIKPKEKEPLYLCCGKTKRYNKPCSKKVKYPNSYCKAHVEQELNAIFDAEVKAEQDKQVLKHTALGTPEYIIADIKDQAEDHIYSKYEAYANNDIENISGDENDVVSITIDKYKKSIDKKGKKKRKKKAKKTATPINEGVIVEFN